MEKNSKEYMEFMFGAEFMASEDKGTIKEYDDHECDHCEGNEEYYEFYQDGHRYHGYECGICGKLLQTG